MNRKLRTAFIASFAVLAVAATLSLAFLAASQWWPGATSAHIRWGDHSTAISGVFDSGLLKFMAAWAAITLAILISVAAVLFAFTLSAIALGTVALFMALPMLVMAACIWWIVRRNSRDQLPQRGAPSAQV